MPRPKVADAAELLRLMLPAVLTLAAEGRKENGARAQMAAMQLASTLLACGYRREAGQVERAAE